MSNTNEFTIIRQPRKMISDGFVGSDDAKQDEIIKSHVKQHTRTTKSGKMVEVKEHDDKRQKKSEEEQEDERREQPFKIFGSKNAVSGFHLYNKIKDSKSFNIIEELEKKFGKGKYTKDQYKKLVKNYEEFYHDWGSNYGYDEKDSKDDEKKEEPKQKKFEMKPFTETDWYGFAGAEKFSDGSQPFIGEVNLKINGKDNAHVVICDKENVQMFGDPDVSDGWMHFTLPDNMKDKPKLAKKFVEFLLNEPNLDDEFLKEHGFEIHS